MDRHRRMAKERVEPKALGRHGAHARERHRVAARDEHQAGEEDAEAAQDRGRPRHDLAVLVAGGEEDARGGEREDERPQQKRAALAPPERGHLVERRRGGRGVVGHERDREVGAQERGLEHDDADHQERGRGVDGAARGVDPAPVARVAAVDPGRGAVGERDERADEARVPRVDRKLAHEPCALFRCRTHGAR